MRDADTKTNWIIKAYQFALEKHATQKRKDGKPYFSHLQAVANIVDDDFLSLIPRSAQEIWLPYKNQIIAAAYLHDVVEDSDYTGVSLNDLREEGFSELIVALVNSLSKREGESYFDFVMRIKESGAIFVAAAAIKRADIRHNKSDLAEGSLKDKYRLAEYILTVH